jgi:hypothetical protein
MMTEYLVCGWCLGQGARLISDNAVIGCEECDERGYKRVGEELEMCDMQ